MRDLTQLLDRAARELREVNERRREDGHLPSAAIAQLLLEIDTALGRATPHQPRVIDYSKCPAASEWLTGYYNTPGRYSGD
jgi:hypothetical protein